MHISLFRRFRQAKLTVFGTGLLIVAGIMGCSGSNATASLDSPLVIQGELKSCTADSMRIYAMYGAIPKQIGSGKVSTSNGTSTFSIEAKLPRKGVYMVGDDPRRAASFLFEGGGNYSLTGNCQNPMATYKIANSPINDGYQKMIGKVNSHNQRVNQLVQNIRLFQMSDPSQVTRLQSDLDTENKTYHGYMDSLAKAGGILGKVAGIYNFKPFGYDPTDQQKYGSDIDHFEKTFFAGIDFNDEETAALPQLYEKAQGYAATLPQTGMTIERMKGALDAVLGKAKTGSIGHETLLRGYLGAMEQSKNELYVDYGKLYIATYNNDPGFKSAVQASVSQLEAFRPGAVAPEITQPTPEGQMLSLSSLRGKVVLIDFWASWCGPCRRENPNVVAMYKKYQKAGFEIFGVSLDKEKQKWVDAIAQDGLTWKHVSDLGGWSAAPARAYGVNSIPATVLIDKEGKIIARNLRGPALEDKMAEIFGF